MSACVAACDHCRTIAVRGAARLRRALCTSETLNCILISLRRSPYGAADALSVYYLAIGFQLKETNFIVVVNGAWGNVPLLTDTSSQGTRGGGMDMRVVLLQLVCALPWESGATPISPCAETTVRDLV